MVMKCDAAGEMVSKTVLLKKDSLIIGSKGSDLKLEDDHCACQHAMLYQGLRGELRVMDMQTTAGTFVGEELVKDMPIGPGSHIRIGDTVVSIVEYECEPSSLGESVSPNKAYPINLLWTEKDSLGRIYDEEPGSLQKGLAR